MQISLANDSSQIRITNGDLHWAHYSRETGELVARGKDWLCTPTDDELAEWAPVAAETSSRLRGVDLDMPVFIRFGSLPRSGKSRNHASGKAEAGLSCYRATLNIATLAYELTGPGLSGAAIIGAAGGYDATLLVTGREVGRGSDGEPLVADAVIIGALTYDPARGGYQF